MATDPNAVMDQLQKRSGCLKTSLLPGIAITMALWSLIFGDSGIIEIEPGEVAVIYNTTNIGLFGEEHRVVQQQGTITYVPWFQRVEVLDIEPRVLRMEGNKRVNEDHGRRLTVRASDGSNFWFNKLEIHYQAIPAHADFIVNTHGRGTAYRHHAVQVHSRGILRDEFGRYSFLEAANPASYGKGTSDAKNLLNDRLRKTGIEVTQIITPKPSFAGRVEKAIKDRQTADQEVLVFAKQRDRLGKQRARLKQGVSEKKNAEYQSLMAKLAADLQKAKNKAVSVQREADKYAIGRRAKGKAIHTEKITAAKAQTYAARERAKGLAAKINAVGDEGPDVLNVEIAKHIFPQLKRLRAVPYALPSHPVDIRHLGLGGRVGKGGK
ncbi:MAG: hypothetical protein KC502_01865 [Myxococcales bacterium]|nr:hypothetical protein [Myxococcales bacterium]